MTAGVQPSRRPARTALILSMAARMGVDIAPSTIFGKPEMLDLWAFRAGRDPPRPPETWLINAWRERPRRWQWRRERRLRCRDWNYPECGRPRPPSVAR